MNKFKDTLKLIEEGLLKPMSDVEAKQVDDDAIKEVIDDILSRSTKNADGSIDVDGDVDLFNLNLKKLPLKFNKVNGGFYCSNNKLTSIEGAPKHVNRSFMCYGNKLTSLQGAPQYVGISFDCSFNMLTSLDGAPLHVGDTFRCHDNAIDFIEDDVRDKSTVGRRIYV